MRLKRSLIVTFAALLAAAVLVVVFAPFLVGGALRLWAERAARREGLQLEIGKIEAPLLRPVVVHDVRLRADGAAPFLDSSRKLDSTLLPAIDSYVIPIIPLTSH